MLVQQNDHYDAAFAAAVVSVRCGIVHGNVEENVDRETMVKHPRVPRPVSCLGRTDRNQVQDPD
jgi:hypothetical protein